MLRCGGLSDRAKLLPVSLTLPKRTGQPSAHYLAGYARPSRSTRAPEATVPNAESRILDTCRRTPSCALPLKAALAAAAAILCVCHHSRPLDRRLVPVSRRPTGTLANAGEHMHLSRQHLGVDRQDALSQFLPGSVGRQASALCSGRTVHNASTHLDATKSWKRCAQR